MGLPQSLNRYGQGIIVWKFSQQKLIVMTNPGYDNAEWLYKSLDAFYAVLNKCGNVYGNGSVMLWLGHWQCREVLLYCWYLQETFADWDILQTVAGSKNNPTTSHICHVLRLSPTFMLRCGKSFLAILLCCNPVECWQNVWTRLSCFHVNTLR